MTASLRISLTVACAASLLVPPTISLAQDASEPGPVEQTADPLEADFKGSVGLGLIGAELGFVLPALAGARDAWAFIVFPILGAGGGAAAGYFLLERNGGEPELAVAALTAGMALVIPAMVVTLAATSYEQEEEAPRVAAPGRAARLAAAAGPGLVRWSERGVLLAPPAIGAGESISAKEALRTGVERHRTVQVAVLSGVF